jgi:hypothetical protein
MHERYTACSIRDAVVTDIDRLFAPWRQGRSETYTPDPATKELVALGYWLREELARVVANEVDSRTQQLKYNRLSRTYDIWETAAECLNDVLDGNVQQDRRAHRRWG